MSGAPAAAPGPQQSGVVPDRDVPLPGDQLRALSAVAPEVSRGPGPWAWLLGVTRRVRGGSRNTDRIDGAMIALFSARVCLGHLSRVDDAIQCAWWAGLRRSFAAEVLKTSAKPQQLAQALQLTGVAQLLQARAAAFYSKRAPFLVGDVVGV